MPAENAVDETRKPNPARSYAELLYGRDWRVKAGIVAAGGEGQQKKPSPQTPYKENLSLSDRDRNKEYLSLSLSDRDRERERERLTFVNLPERERSDGGAA